jgi:hypothetical protein
VDVFFQVITAAVTPVARWIGEDEVGAEAFRQIIAKGNRMARPEIDLDATQSGSCWPASKSQFDSCP